MTTLEEQKLENKMETIKNHIIPILISSFITGLIALCMSIFSDLLPIILPSLYKVSIALYLKFILLLAFLLCISLVVLTIYRAKSKEFRPFKKKGEYKGFKWVAEINTYDPHQGWDVWVNFLCPVHNVYLGRKDANVPECNFGILWCKHCDKEYPFQVEGSVIHLEEVEQIIKDEVISKLKIRENS